MLFLAIFCRLQQLKITWIRMKVKKPLKLKIDIHVDNLITRTDAIEEALPLFNGPTLIFTEENDNK